MTLRFSGKVTMPQGKLTLNPKKEIVFVDSNQNTSSGEVTSHVALPISGAEVGDILIACLSLTNNTNIGPSSFTSQDGFTAITSVGTGNGSVNRTTEFFQYRIVTGSEPADYEWTWSTSHNATFCLLAFSNVNTLDPIDTSSTFSTSDASTINLPSITTALNGAMLVQGYVITGPSNNTPSAVPSGFTEAEVGVDGSPGTNAGYKFRKGYILTGTAGATGTQTFTFSNGKVNSNAPSAVMVALNPA